MKALLVVDMQRVFIEDENYNSLNAVKELRNDQDIYVFFVTLYVVTLLF